VSEYGPPEPGDTEPTRFVDPLTGQALPTPPGAAARRPSSASAVPAAAGYRRRGFGRRVLNNPTRIGLSVAGVLSLAAFLGIAMVIGPLQRVHEPGGRGHGRHAAGADQHQPAAATDGPHDRRLAP
jgi:hypothetical protein